MIKCILVGIEGTPECGRNISAHRKPLVSRSLNHRQKSLNRSLDGRVDVLLIECFAYGSKDGNLINTGIDGPVKPSFVRHQRRINHCITAENSTENFLRIAELWHPPRRNESAHFNLADTCRGQGIYESNLGLRRNVSCLVLQSVPGGDFNDLRC